MGAKSRCNFIIQLRPDSQQSTYCRIFHECWGRMGSRTDRVTWTCWYGSMFLLCISHSGSLNTELIYWFWSVDCYSLPRIPIKSQDVKVKKTYIIVSLLLFHIMTNLHFYVAIFLCGSLLDCRSESLFLDDHSQRSLVPALEKLIPESGVVWVPVWPTDWKVQWGVHKIKVGPTEYAESHL